MLRFLPPALWLFLAAAAVLLFAVRHDPFFWDTVQLASKHAHHFYENGLRFTPLPPSIDSGHPPLLGYYLAWMWRLFGKTLPVSHAAMAPFLLAVVALLYRLGVRLGGPRRVWWLLPLVLLDPVVAGQSVLMSPDLMVAAGFLLALAALLAGRPLWAAAGILLLCAASMRGMMTAAALFAWQLSLNILPRLFSSRRSENPAAAPPPTLKPSFHPLLGRGPGGGLTPALIFLPGFLLGAAFLLWHHRVTGWTGHHPDSPWAPAFARVDWSGFIGNGAIVGWRWLDFGRIAEWIAAGFLFLGWRHGRAPGPDRTLLLLLAWLVVFLTPSALLYANLSAHRYFLPGFLALHLMLFHWLARYPVKSWVKTLTFVLLTGMLAAGNRWLYPRDMAVGWDSTLAHQPYHRLRAEAVAFLDAEKIDFQTVGSQFPNLNTGEDLMLNGDGRRFAELDFTRNRYLMLSNIFNDFPEADDYDLFSNWEVWQRWEHAGVWIELYRRKP